MRSKPSPTLDELLAVLVKETPDVKARGADFARNGVVFAARPQPNAIELRLGPDIADAALRTPDTRPSSRGEDWVLLQTDDWLDADDRLEAWFRVAWRLAAKQNR